EERSQGFARAPAFGQVARIGIGEYRRLHSAAQMALHSGERRLAEWGLDVPTRPALSASRNVADGISFAARLAPLDRSRRARARRTRSAARPNASLSSKRIRDQWRGADWALPSAVVLKDSPNNRWRTRRENRPASIHRGTSCERRFAWSRATGSCTSFSRRF